MTVNHESSLRCWRWRDKVATAVYYVTKKDFCFQRFKDTAKNHLVIQYHYNYKTQCVAKLNLGSGLDNEIV